MPSLPENINANISPTDFELLVKEYLENVGRELKDFSASHDVHLLKSDGEYQIDIYAEFEVLGGANLKVLVECKRHKSDIKREVVQLLYDKLRATGTHKGMLFSTSGFQSGAYKFAEEHGIALIRVIDGQYTYVTKSCGEQTYSSPWADTPKYVGQYTRGTMTTFLQKGYFEDLEEFLFGNEIDSKTP